MAYKDFGIADFNQASYFKSWARNNYGGLTRGYTTPSSNTQVKGVTVSGIPAGATITAYNVYFNVDTGLYGGTYWPESGASVDPSNISFYWKSRTGGSYPDYPAGDNKDSTYYQDKTGLCKRTGIYVRVTYTDPPPPPESGLSLNSQHLNAGDDVIATISPKSSGYWHRFSVWLGTESYTVDTAENSATFTIPMSWLAQIPNAAVGLGGAWLQTFSGETQIGVTKYLDLYIYVPASVVPTITGFTATLVSNGVDASITRYVQNYSKCLLEITGAEGGSYSPITGYSITGGGISSSAATGTFGPFNLPGDVVFTAKVTDARGRTATRQVAIEIMPYSAPTFSSPEAWRSNYDGVKNQKGTYVRLKSGASFSSLGDQNAVTLKGRVYIKGGEAPAWETMTPDTELILGGGTLLSTRTYIAQIQVSDLLESRITEFIIPAKRSGLSIMSGVSGAAIGKSAETPGILEVAWPIVAPNIPPNPNILHNWDWRNPVNQRGISSTMALAYQYVIDRWAIAAGTTVTVNAASMSVSAGGTIQQIIEGGLLAGKQVTVSIEEANGTIGVVTGVFPLASGDLNLSIPGFGGVRLSIYAGNAVFALIPSNATAISRVKLELGSISTLHLDPPMDYAVEVPKCLRFYQIPSNWIRPIYVSANTIIFPYPLQVPMRVVPTVLIPSYTNLLLTQGVGQHTPTGHSTGHSTGNFYPSAIELVFTGDFSGADYFTGVYSINAIRFSSDL